MRVRDGERLPSPCMTAVVKRKWKDRSRRAGSIPSSVPIRTIVRGRRCSVQVPIDVVERVRGSLHAGRAGAGIRIAHPNWNDPDQPTGTVTCMVRERNRPNSTPHVLSCHHVIALSKFWPFPRFQEFPDYRVGLRDAQGQPGTLALLPANRRRTDAALASLSQGTNWSNGPRIRDILRNLSEETVPFEYELFSGNSGESVPAQFLRFETDYCLDGYEGGATTLCFRRVLLSSCDTSGGDSGAPLVDAIGRLIAMHIAGQDGVSFALPIEDVLDAFSPGRVLA